MGIGVRVGGSGVEVAVEVELRAGPEGDMARGASERIVPKDWQLQAVQSANSQPSNSRKLKQVLFKIDSNFP
ncbi:MAG: hypothetical protein BroJett011_05370 [Chloroflexota bacterium]|nr:MAG: hypothetical protein BroJett011_05370 [Chloroflexota bacterium]